MISSSSTKSLERATGLRPVAAQLVIRQVTGMKFESVTRRLQMRLDALSPIGLNALQLRLRAAGVLPLVEDMSSWSGLRPDLKWFYASEDNDGVSELDPDLRMAFLMAAVERVPELKELVPIKPADAVVCFNCAGSGYFEVAGLRGRSRCGNCCTLGWLPRGYTDVDHLWPVA